MGFKAPTIPAQPPPPPQAPSLPAILSNRSRQSFGTGVGSLGGTFLTGPVGNPMNVPGSIGKVAGKTLTGQ